MNKQTYNLLDLVSSKWFENHELNLSDFNKKTIESVLNLRIIEDNDINDKILNKYKYYDNYFILKINKKYHFINTEYIGKYYENNNKPLVIKDYNILQRKDKLKKIQKNISL